MTTIFNAQREYFNSGATLSLTFRITQLKRLKTAVKAYEPQLLEALYQDLGKPVAEAYISEISMVYNEIDLACKNLAKWMKPQHVKTPLNLFHSHSYIQRVPLGCVLIIAPWNYPVTLLLNPLIGAIAAGNCVVLKPSEISSNTANIMTKLIEEHFAANYIAVINGVGAEIVPWLINEGSFNHVMFTGSSTVGKSVAKLCAEHLIPYTLELGGKSPAIVGKDANLKIAARRIIWGKFFNCGQTCIAPDYLLIHEDVYPEMVRLLSSTITEFSLNKSGSDGKIIDQRQFDRLITYLHEGHIISGGNYDVQKLQIEPTLIENIPDGAQIMKDEIFGPILPLIKYKTAEDLAHKVRQHPYPLAMYIFSNNRKFYNNLIRQIECGGVGVNTCLYHCANLNLPFGGVMYSGNGNYHGKFSFDMFSHPKAVVNSSIWPDISFKYPPYTKLKLWFLKLF